MKSYTRSLSLFLLLLLAGIGSLAQFNLSQPLPTDPNVRIGKLSNGLTYYIRKNTTPEKKVELRLAVNAGAIQEAENQRGLAHFMEHMNFNGSKNFPKNELVNYLQKVGVQFGADLNAYTSFDETVYMLPISSDDPEILEKGFTVLEDWAFNNLLDKAEIEKERGVVLEESRLSKGAQERMLRQYFPKLFNGSLYAERLPIGKDEVLRSFKPETLEKFYRNWYRPNLMAVVVVGDIDPADIEKKIKAHFGGFKNPPNAPARPAIIPIKPRTKAEAMVLTDEEATNTILQVFNFIRPAKKVTTWGDYRQTVVDELMTALVSQRLQELTQKENPPFVYGFTGLESFIRGYETFVSFAVIGNNTVKEAIDALVGETERARKFGFLPSELERAKASLLNAAERSYNEKDKSQSGQIVNEYVSHFLEKEPIPGAENRYKFLQQVLKNITLNEINAVAKKMPSSQNAFALLQAPASMKDKLPTNAAMLGNFVAASKQQVKPYTEKAIASNLIENAGVEGKVVKEEKNDALGTTDLTLSNGITITLKPTNYKNDEIVMDAWRLGGYHRFPLADKDNAKHAAEMVMEMGVKDMTPTDLQKFTSGKTVSVMPYINEQEEGIQGNSSVKDFETFLQLINLYFTQPRKDEGLFKSTVSKQKSMVQFIKANPRAFYQDTLMKIIYNNNPWVSAIPTEEEFNALNLEKSMAIYNQIYGNADGMHFTFVGNIDVAKAKPLFEKYLGSLPGTPTEHNFKDNNVRPVRGVVEANIKKGKDAKSLITMMWSGETQYNSKEKLSLQALIEVLNITVIEKLREELGGMYSGGLMGSISKRPYANYSISAFIPCGPENVEKLTNAMLGIIKNAQENGVSQSDFDKVKETWKKQHRVSMQTNDGWLNGLSTAFIDQENPQGILEFEKKVDALTLADLQKAAQKYFDMKNFVRAVLYPENADVPAGVQKKTF
jgi:zinc protease